MPQLNIFQEGDLVEYIGSSSEWLGYRAIVYSSDNYITTCTGVETEVCRRVGYPAGSIIKLYTKGLRLAGSPKSPEEQVIDKIKLMWDRSNYVK